MSIRLLRVSLYVVCTAAIIILSQFVIELRQANEDQTRADFNSFTSIFTRDVEHTVTSAINHALSIGALMESSKAVSEVEFSRFILRSRLLTDSSSIRAVATLPLLSRQELPAFREALKAREQSRIAFDYPPFEIKESPDRDVYAPVVYVESLAGRDGILGYDLTTSPERMATARAALLSAQPHMTPPIILTQDTGKDITSVLLLSAVKSGGNMGLRDYKSPSEDRTTFVAVSFSPSIAINSIMNRLQLREVFDIHIADITDAEPVSIYGDATPVATGSIRQDHRLVFGNRVWLLTYISKTALSGWQNSKRFLFLAAIAFLLIVALTVSLDRLIKGRGALESDVKERTEQLNSMNEMLQTSVAKANAESEAKSLFLAHMSHELRTPLNAVIGYAQMLKSQIFGKLRDKRYIDYAATIEDAGNIQLQLIEDILALISLQGGTRELERKIIDLDAVAQKCIDLVKQRATKKQLTLKIVSVLGKEAFLGDERSIQQIIINLLSNAIKFTPPTGQITVRLSRDNLGVTSIAVEDTGVGIDAKYIDKVLQPFGQAHVNPYNAHEGVGLGLSIVSGLTEASGGRIRIESEPDKGTTVIIEFPPGIEPNSIAYNI